MKLRKKTQKVLAAETGLSRATIVRMIANTDNRSGRYRTTEEVVVKICMAIITMFITDWEGLSNTNSTT